MEFYSHLKKDEKGNIIPKSEKLISDHIDGIKDCVSKTIPVSGLAFSDDNFRQLIDEIIKLHDLGKYTIWFQEYLKLDKKHPKDFHNHALIGAITAYKSLKNKGSGWFLIAYFTIRYHHANLNDIQNSYYTDDLNSEWLFSERQKQIQAQYNNLLPKLETINKELNLALNPELLGDDLPMNMQREITLFWEILPLKNTSLLITSFPCSLKETN